MNSSSYSPNWASPPILPLKPFKKYLYNQIERDFMNPFQYERASDESSIGELVQLLDDLWELILPNLEVKP